MSGGLRPHVLARLRAHLGDGHRVVIVTASPELHAVPIGALLGVEATLGTRLALDDRGRLTGRYDGANNRGHHKVDRLRARWGDDEPDELHAYGNSSGDAEMLELADVATMVRGSGPL